MNFKCYALEDNTLERVIDSNNKIILGNINENSNMQISVRLQINNEEFDNIVMSDKLQKQKVYYINLRHADGF